MVRITPAEYVATVEKFAKINERATKRGFTGRLDVVGERVEVTSTDALGFDKTEVFYDVEIGGEAPSYNGWTFLARCDREGDTFTIATAPGVEHVDRSLVHPGVCDHCGFDRRRNNTYLVVNTETGQTVNVGSTCIKDFLGWSASVVFFAEGDSEIELGGYSYSTPSYSVEYLLAVSYAAIRAMGWVASSSYSGTPTAGWVRTVLNPPARMTDSEKAALAQIREFAAEANDMAAQVKAFILSDEFAGTSTYVENLKVAVSLDHVSGKQIGILASAPQAYIRHLERQAGIEAAKVTKAVSDYIGQPGDKVEVAGTISAIRYIEGEYGTTTLYTITTVEGNLVKWFASREALGETTGVEVKIKGTVKKHDEYQGTKSTVLTRCKAI